MFEKDPVLAFDFQDPYSPIFMAAEYLKTLPQREGGWRILDVGCNAGYLGKEVLKSRPDLAFNGVDINQEALALASNNGYQAVYALDLSRPEVHFQESYDLLVFLDVLEHLPDPLGLLRRLSRDNLKPGGMVLVCLPNIGRLECRLEHLLGRWEYQKGGILHQDHLRFFTRRTMIALCQDAGLKVEAVRPTGLGARFGLWPTLTAFQFLLHCRKGQEDQPSSAC